MLNKKNKNTKLLKILTFASIAASAFPLIAISCENKETKIKKNISIEGNKIDVVIANKLNKLPSSIKDGDIIFNNYNNKEFDIKIVKKESDDDKGILKITVRITSKIINSIFLNRTISVSGFKQKNENKPNAGVGNINFDKSDNIIYKDKKINYLAIGDSISAGFSASLDKDYHGKIVNNKIEGMSLPAYLAHFLNKDDSKRVSQFNNFATSNSTILEWLDLLDVKYQSKKPDIFKNEDGLYEHTFDGRYSNKNEFKKDLINKIKESNLLTITLGANDFLRFFTSVLEATNFNDVIKELQNGNQIDYKKLIEFYTKFMELCKNEIKDRLTILLQKIHEINPKTNVVLFNYPAPFLRFISILHNYFPNDVELPNTSNDTLSRLMQPLTDAIRESQTEIGKNIHFIDLFDAPYWNEHQETLSSIVFDIHPTVFGYKKMAIDAFIKLTANSINKKTLDNFGWSKDYLNNLEKNPNKQIIELTTENSENLYIQNFGNNKESSFNKILEEDEIYLNIKSKLNPNNISRRLFNFSNNQIKEIFLSLLRKSSKIKLINEIDPNKDIYNFFINNKNSADKLVEWVKKSNYIGKQIDDFQRKILEEDLDGDGKPGAKTLKKEYILKILNETFLNKENIFKLVKDFSSSDFAKDFRKPLSELIEKISKNLLKSEKIKKLIEKNLSNIDPKEDFISKEDQKTLLNKVFNSDKLTSFIKSAFNSLLENSGSNAMKEEFKKINSFNQFIKFIFKNHPQNGELQQAFSNIFKELINDNEIKNILIKIVQNFISKNEIFKPLFKEIEQNDQNKIFSTFLDIFINLENEFSLSNEFANGIIAELGNNGTNLKFDYFINSFYKNMFAIFQKDQNIVKAINVIRKNEVLKNNFDTFKKFINNGFEWINNGPILENFLFNNELIKNILKGLSIENQESTKSLIKSLIKDPSLKIMINQFLDLFFSEDLNIDSAKNFLEIIKTLANNPKIESIKNTFKDFLKTLFNDSEAKLAKQIEILITNNWKSNAKKYNIDVIDKNENTIKNFVDAFLKSAIKNDKLFNTITDKVFEQMKKINIESKNVLLELKNNLILGLIKFVTKEESPTVIHLPTLMSEYKNEIINIFNDVNNDVYTKMINYIFEVSKFNLDEGIYSILLNGKYKDLAKENIEKIKNDNSKLENIDNNEEKDNNESIKITFNIGSGLELISLINSDQLISTLFLPAIKTFFNESLEMIEKDGTNLDIKKIKKLSGYKAANRIYTSLVLMLVSNITLEEFWPNGGGFFSFYNAGIYPENFISKAMGKTYKDILQSSLKEDKDKIINKLQNLDENNLSKLGIEKYGSIYSYDKHFFAGYSETNDDTRNLKFRNFEKWNDSSILAFIANPEKEDNKYHNEKNIVLIIKLLQNGYLYKDMDKE